jgi:hypothetical protein
MDSFYFLVLSIATVILILLLIILGVLMSYSKNKITHPPSYSNCPDYWTTDTDNKSCTVPVNNSSDKRNFNIPSTGYDTITNTPGYTTGKIDFTNPDWNTRSKTRECAIKDWSNKYGVEWDGISNFNGC